MRMFIAIEFEPDVKKYLKEAQSKLVPFSKRGSFTDENNMHLTVKFIGEVSSDDVSALAEGLQEAAARSRAFSLRLSHLGFFPKGNRTIVWAGIEDSPALSRLFQNIEKSLQKQGFPRERKGISPHITLGREVDLTEKFDTIKERIPLEPLDIPANKISLMESKRVGGKLVYRSVFVQDLK